MDEVAQLSAPRDMRGRASEHVLGLDGIGAVLLYSSPLQHLTMAQLKGLFTVQLRIGVCSGAHLNWFILMLLLDSLVCLTPSSRWSCKAIRSERPNAMNTATPSKATLRAIGLVSVLSEWLMSNRRVHWLSATAKPQRSADRVHRED